VNARLYLTAAEYTELRTYLFGSAERVAFMFTQPGDARNEECVTELRLLDDHDYLQRDRHGVELADYIRPQLIRAAHEHGYALVEAHAHHWPGLGTQFSSTDLDGLLELGPHMTWRLPSRPYTALVFGPDSFDALLWRSGISVTTIEALVVEKGHLLPTGATLSRLTRDTSEGFP
jgi:hypothetical protein